MIGRLTHSSAVQRTLTELFRQAVEPCRPLATGPGRARTVVNWVLPDPNGSSAYDAVAEDWFDDAAAMGAAFASPQGQAVAADVPSFLDPSRFALLIVAEEDVPLPTGSAASSAG